MKIKITKFKLTRLCVVLATIFIFTPIESFAQSNESSKPKKQTTYKKARVLQTATAKKIAKVTEALERVKIVEIEDKNKKSETFGQMIPTEEPDPDYVTAKKILLEMRSKAQDMKSYDRSILWNYWGYIYYTEEADKKDSEDISFHSLLSKSSNHTSPLYAL